MVQGPGFPSLLSKALLPLPFCSPYPAHSSSCSEINPHPRQGQPNRKAFKDTQCASLVCKSLQEQIWSDLIPAAPSIIIIIIIIMPSSFHYPPFKRRKPRVREVGHAVLVTQRAKWQVWGSKPRLCVPKPALLSWAVDPAQPWGSTPSPLPECSRHRLPVLTSRSLSCPLA